jgi:hypothetical protein
LRRSVLLAVLFIFVFMMPVSQPNTDFAAVPDNLPSLPEGTGSYAEAGDYSTGTGPALNVVRQGTILSDDGSLTFDSSSPGVSSVTLTNGWTGTNLAAELDGLTATMEDVLQNGNLNGYHTEKFIVSSSSSRNDDNVNVPDGWTFIKDVPSDDPHPYYGIYKIRSDSSGYSGRGLYTWASWGTGGWTHSASDEIYISQMISLPWREVYSAQVSFRYRVSASSMDDGTHLFVEIGGYYYKFHVFESGDTQSTWLSASISIPASSMAGLSDHVTQFKIGLATDLTGTSVANGYYAYIDDIVVDFIVRPFPEQVDLRANGTAIVGTQTYSVYPYVPDDANRDCYDTLGGGGIDLDGYSNDGGIEVGMYDSAYWYVSAKFQLGLQFPVDIPQGAIITDAWVEMEAQGGSGTPLYGVRLYLADEDTVSAFTTGLPVLEDRFSWVPTSVNWPLSSWITWPETRYRSPDISGLLQNVISRSGWSEGNYICVMADLSNADYFQRYDNIKGSAGYDGEDLARLFVEYMVPLPEDVVNFYSYEKDITIDHTKVDAELTDFPVLIDIWDSDLRQHVQDGGSDILFMIGDQALYHEIELFDIEGDGTNSHLVAWVKVPTLSSSVDTVITMKYGNSYAVDSSSSQVWSDYEIVQHLSDSPSDVLYDSTTNNHVGTAYGGMDSLNSVFGKVGNAAYFDGSNDAISVGQIHTDDWTQFSVSAWIYQDAQIDARIFSKARSTSTSDAIIHLAVDDSPNIMRVRLGTDTTSSYSIDGTTALTTGNWNYLTWTWSASTGMMYMYLNGSLERSLSYGGNNIADSDIMFIIGNWQTETDSPRFFNGSIDEIRMLPAVRSQQWFSTEFNNQADPSSFYSVGSQRSAVDSWSDAGTTSVVFTTSSSSSVTMDVIVTMDISGIGQTLDSSYNPGTDFYIESGATIVNWTGRVMVSPPAGVTNMGFTVEYPVGEWKPTRALNPFGEAKTEGSDWWYSGGYLTINRSSIDFWGIWTVEFISMNYVENLQLGIAGETLGDTATFNIGDQARFMATTPTYTGGTVGFVLTDPSGSVWYQDSNTTAATPSHKFPSFRYHKDLVVSSDYVYDDVTNFPVLFDFYDTDLHSSAKVKADASDLMFAIGSTVLPHEIEYFDQGATPTQARLVAWVLANLSQSTPTTITMYYGSDLLDNLENPEAIWAANGYDAVYHLGETVVDEASGATHYDSSGNGYDATQYGNDDAILGTNRGVSQVFDGVDDQILVPDTLNPEGDLIISGWFRLTSNFDASSPTSYLIMEKYLNDDVNMHIGLVGTDYTASVPFGTLVFKVESLTGGAMYKYTTTTSWLAGWHHFACFLDSSAPSNNRIYIDGFDRTDSGSSGSSTWASLAFAANWGIGGGDVDMGFPNDQGWFPGAIDEVRISSNAARSAQWLRTEWRNQQDADTFATAMSEEERSSPGQSIDKTIDATAPAGPWAVIAHYNDSGSYVTNKTGLYERTFIVKHDTALALNKPTDAVGDRITVKNAGDSIILEYQLEDSITAAGIAGATVTINWTTPSTITLDDYGGGRYGVVLDTNDLADAGRWRVDVDSSHQYYNDATEYILIDLFHTTELDYSDASTIPVGQDFTATLEFTDTYTDDPIVGATITFGDDSPVNVVSEGGGLYYISIDTSGLALGDHVYTLKATKAGSYMNIAAVQITVRIRAHYTAVSVSGSMTAPYGENLPLHVVLLDLDTGTIVDIGDVDQFNFTSSEGEEIKQFLFTYDMTLTTNSWDIGVYTVALRVVISDTDYFQPDDYQFDVTIRQHRTSVSVAGVVTQPYGNVTPLTVVITDLDTGGTITYGNVGTLAFTWPPSGSQVESSLSSLDVELDTSTWSVNSYTVTLAVSMSNGIYQNPSNHVFAITIRPLSVMMYHDPASLYFPIGDDFTIDLRLNVSEQGVYFGDPVTGRGPGEFSVSGYTISIDTTEQAVGRYGLTIDSAYFAGGFYEITVRFVSASPLYEDVSVKIRFRYTDIATFLSSPNFPQVTTPYNLDLEIILNYTQAYSGVGIDGATIDSPDHPSWIINATHISGGLYSVWINVTGFPKGTYYLNLTANKANHELKELEFRIVVREAFTSAVPSVGSLTIPIGNSPVFYADFTDIDRLTPIDNTTSPYTQVVSDWSNFSVVYLPGTQQYQITFHTSLSDTIAQNQVYYFTFSKGANYKIATFTISVSIRTHSTDFRLVSSIAPVSTIGTFTISVYYGDLDSAVGIRSGLVDFYVENATGLILSSYSYDDATGDGFYLIYVDADQFGLGLQTFTIYADWTGVVAVYQDKSIVVTASVVGRESALTLLVASDPTAYGEEMSYTFFFSDTGTPIDNITYSGNVHIYVAFPTESVDLGLVTITDLSATQAGNYSISFNTNIFDRIGFIFMNVYVNWSKGVAPYYTNRTETVSVRVLSRDTLLSISPPSATSWNETAQFTFTWEDLVAGPGTYIADDLSLTIEMSVSFTYSETGGIFTVFIDTNQFASLGLKAMTFSVKWDGAPFYANRTGRTVYLSVLARQTSLEYLAPAPTQYLDEVVFNVTWTDVTGGSSTPIGGGSLELLLGAAPVDAGKYSWYEITPGVYEVTLNTTFVASPGTYSLKVTLSTGLFYILDVSAPRDFVVRTRITLLSAEPISRVPHNASMVVVLYYQDLFTSDAIANDSAASYPVSFEILTAGTWYYTVEWKPTFGYYVFTVETWNQGYNINVYYTIQLRMSYAVQSPYYASDDLTVEFRFRARESTLSVDTQPETTPYGFDTSFIVQYTDDDEGDAGIDGATIYLEYNSVPLAEGVDYTLTPSAGGYYAILLETDILSGLGTHVILVNASWSGVPYYISSSVDVAVNLRERETSLEITIPPSQTKFLDDITFTFVYTDLDSDLSVTSITQANVFLYFTNGTLIPSGYTVTPSGSGYAVTFNSTLIASSPQSGVEIDLLVDWDGGTEPYYADHSITVRVSVVKRTMVVSPNQIERTPLSENSTITFSVTDTDTDIPVSGAIVVFTCQNDTMVLGTTYSLSEITGVYTITVNTNWLTAGTGNYLFGIEVRWNPAAAPFYTNKTKITLVGFVDEYYTSLEAGAPQPSTQQVTGQIWLEVTYRNLDTAATVPSATLTPTIVGIGTPVGSSVVEISPGVYNVSFYTNGLDPDVGTYRLNILAQRSGYDDAGLQVTFAVTYISTSLQAVSSLVTVDWGEDANIAVIYTNLLAGSPAEPPASVVCTYQGADLGTLSYVGSGVYELSIPTDSLGAGTRVVVITASKEDYVTQVVTITLIINALPSQMIPVSPLSPVETINKGAPLDVLVQLKDEGGFPISNVRVLAVTIIVEGQEFPMEWADPNWQGTIPGSVTAGFEVLNSYNIRIIASFNQSYDPCSYSFQVYVEEIRTSLVLVGFPENRTEVTYGDSVTYRVYLEAPDFSLPINESRVWWFQGVNDWTGAVNFTSLGNGTYTLLFDTIVASYGTWGLTFKASPYNATFGDCHVSLTLVIKKIPTRADLPPETPVLIWGWKGNISVDYVDTVHHVGVSGATVIYVINGTEYPAVDLGNGTYLIYVDTTQFEPQDTRYLIYVEFQLENYDERTAGLGIRVVERPTAWYLSTPGYVDRLPSTDVLELPMGDVLNITFYYNDTSTIGGYAGGISGATIYQATFSGPGLRVPTNLPVYELGDGYYYFLFDSYDSDIYNISEGVPTVFPGLKWYFTVVLEYEYRQQAVITVDVEIIDIPVEVIYTGPTELTLIHGDEIDLTFYLNDTWHNRGVVGASVIPAPGRSATVVLGSNISLGAGYYQITIRATDQRGDTVIHVDIMLDYHTTVELEVLVTATPNDMDSLITQFTNIGLPIMLLLFAVLGMYVKVWSVPKRIRQINGQIKSLRKGKIPKAIPDVKSRSQLVADLFNDTYAKTAIKRTADQMPEESIPIEVPELGELLVQLAMLTNLNAQELEEFKADISKMKVSEQAAFVKEVIMQEAIRAARREGRTVEETLEGLEKAAARRLGGEEALEEAEEAETVEHVFLTPEEEEQVVPEAKPTRVTPAEKPAVSESVSERMSPHEIEELRRELERKGVPPYEIDTILEQARTLPRELVEELVKSLEDSRE